MSIFNDEIVVINLEGPIVDRIEDRKKSTLYNLIRITDAFPQAKKVIVSLANNHMYDYPEKLLSTKEALEERGIGTFGFVNDRSVIPYEFVDDRGEKFAFFGHCWRLYTKTNPNRINSIRITDCKYPEFEKMVSDYIVKHPQTHAYCFMHWNYDLEELPFPLYRVLSRRLIDSGVEGVIGSHSHVPQGIEIYKQRVIAYCLGNFYLPSGLYFDGTLTYPDACKKTYGICIHGKEIKCIWFDSDINQKGDVIRYRKSEGVNGKDIAEYSKFSGLSNKQYISYFKNNRVKKTLVPIFGKYQNQNITDLQELFAICRVKGIKTIQKVYKGDRA